MPMTSERHGMDAAPKKGNNAAGHKDTSMGETMLVHGRHWHRHCRGVAGGTGGEGIVRVHMQWDRVGNGGRLASLRSREEEVVDPRLAVHPEDETRDDDGDCDGDLPQQNYWLCLSVVIVLVNGHWKMPDGRHQLSEIMACVPTVAA